MNLYDLTLTANARPETLERILRVVRHRGFAVKQLQAELTAEGYEIRLQLESVRAISLLTHQLEKLFDVKAVKIN